MARPSRTVRRRQVTSAFFAVSIWFAVACTAHVAPAGVQDHGRAVAQATPIDRSLAVEQWREDIDPARHLSPADDGRLPVRRDPALEAILAYEPEPPITEQLLSAFAQGGVEEGRRVFRKYIWDPIHREVVVEGPMNQLGYELLAAGRLDEAVAVFELNVEAYPNSANVYDSLGDGHRARGDLEAAIAAYRKALEVDPNFGPSRENLAQLLGQ